MLSIYLNNFLYDGKSFASAVLAVSSIIIGLSTTREIGYTSEPHAANVISGETILATKAVNIGDSIPISNQLPASGSHNRKTSFKDIGIEWDINSEIVIYKLDKSIYLS